MERFKPGKILHTNTGRQITVMEFIDDGTQGDVYRVSFEGQEKALKWYHPKAIRDPVAFYANLEDNVNKGSPDRVFLWPIAITRKEEGSFGYLMDLIPTGYKKMSTILTTRGGGGFATFKAIADASIKMVSAFRSLYKSGYSYQDLSPANIFINPETGDVLIGDVDNVAPNGVHTGIIGTPQYMAPEIVTGKARPNIHTDEFSLSVVIFMLLCASHPLEGEHWAVPCLTPEIEEALYGSHALFIFDPNDASNRPVRGVHNNVLKRWGFMPDYLKNAFQKAFSQEAIRNPNKRFTYVAWLKVLTRFQSDIVRCPHCRNEIFIKDAASTKCDRCGRMYKVSHTLKLYDYSITAARNTRVYKCQMGVCNADEALLPVALVIEKPGSPDVLGLRNMTHEIMTGTTPSGRVNKVHPGEIVPVRNGIRLAIYDSEILIQ